MIRFLLAWFSWHRKVVSFTIAIISGKRKHFDGVLIFSRNLDMISF